MGKSVNLQTNSLTVASSSGTLALAGGTSFSVASASSFGRVVGTGSVQLTGALTFNFTSITGAGSWDFFSQTPSGTPSSVQLSDSYAGTLLESTPGIWTGNVGGLDWSYVSTTGVLTAVPEPGTVALATLGLTTILFLRRRRKD